MNLLILIFVFCKITYNDYLFLRQCLMRMKKNKINNNTLNTLFKVIFYFYFKNIF